MNYSFQLSCESTVDLPYSYVVGRDMSVLFYNYTVDGKEYTDDMGRDAEALPRFYSLLEAGGRAITSQINAAQYEEYFEALLQKGDLLHICFSSGLTSSWANAATAAAALRKKYPERKLAVVDSLCASSGFGLIADIAADMRDAGKSIEEIENWIIENRGRVNHRFYSTEIKYFRRSGRVSGPAAAAATVLGICPLMRLDEIGRIEAYCKVRGKKNAIEATLAEVEKRIDSGKDYSGKIFVSHSNCPEMAKKVREQLRISYPRAKQVRLCDIGTIIASHSGPGTVAVFFLGKERTAR